MSTFTDSSQIYKHKNRKRGFCSRLHCRKRLSVAKKLLAQNTDQFCQNTTLHGLRYLTDKELYPLEKLFFGISFATVVVLAFYFAARVIDKWTMNPVIFGINPKPTMITDQPFPAVTICNLNQAYKFKAQQYSLYSPEYAMLQMLCRREVNASVADSISDWSNLEKFITDIAQPCSNMLLSCRFGAVMYNCSELFRPIVTDEGFCCVFNMVHPYYMYSTNSAEKDNVSDLAGFKPVSWNSENGYPRDLPPKFYPRPAVGTGETMGLSITLDVEADEYYCSSANSIGFKMLLHSPTELPSLREVGLLLSAGRETKVRIAVEQVETELNLRSMNRKSRHCLFQDEEDLELFSHYTQRNCELECVAEMLMRYCGCISHYMPGYYGNESICSIYDSRCVERIRVNSMLNDKGNYSCKKNCLPGCHDLSYMPDFFSTPLSHLGFQISNKLVKNLSSSYVERNIAITHLYFKEVSYRTSKQTEFFGVTDVFSNIGGLISVFFGLSFISLAELFFYAIIRPLRASRQVSVLNEDVIIINTANHQRYGLVRKRYRRELGFNSEGQKDENEIDISKMYMSGTNVPIRENRIRSLKTSMEHRLKVFKHLLAKNTDQFCQNTTLHGLKYLTDKELYPCERIFFGMAFITVVICALFFVLQVWDKWSTTPVIFGTNPQPSFITEEPFPAVTICNLNVAYKSKAEQFSIFSTEYAMLQMLCKREVNVTIAGSISDWSHLNEFMTDIAQPCSNMFISCTYGAVKYNCSELFKPIITDEGLCCAFNRVHPAFILNSMRQMVVNDSDSNGGYQAVSWSSETGYQKNLPEKFYPRLAAGIGETLGLSLTMDVEADEYYCSSLNSVGFKLIVHNPMESPSLREIGLLLGPGRETKIRLRTEKYEADHKLRGVHRKYRQCLFQDEEKLMLFSHYTQQNCEMECVGKLLLKHCGCISYYMPRFTGNESICSIYQSTCVERMRIASMLSEYNATSCQTYCPASCFDVTFFPDFFSAPIKHDGFQIVNQAVKNMTDSYVQQNIAVVHMYNRENAYRSFKQTELISGTDVLSSIGGLIGLFVGFSFISVAEFIFYAMVRPFRATRNVAEAPENVLILKKPQVENIPAWKKPIRKRYKGELNVNNDGSNRYGNIFVERIHMNTQLQKQKLMNAIVQKWYNRKQFMV